MQFNKLMVTTSVNIYTLISAKHIIFYIYLYKLLEKIISSIKDFFFINKIVDKILDK